MESGRPAMQLAQGLRLGFENFVAPEHLDRQQSVLELDLSAKRLGNLTRPETLNQLFLKVGAQFNEGGLDIAPTERPPAQRKCTLY